MSAWALLVKGDAEWESRITEDEAQVIEFIRGYKGSAFPFKVVFLEGDKEHDRRVYRRIAFLEWTASGHTSTRPERYEIAKWVNYGDYSQLDSPWYELAEVWEANNAFQ